MKGIVLPLVLILVVGISSAGFLIYKNQNKSENPKSIIININTPAEYYRSIEIFKIV